MSVVLLFSIHPPTFNAGVRLAVHRVMEVTRYSDLDGNCDTDNPSFDIIYGEFYVANG